MKKHTATNAKFKTSTSLEYADFCHKKIECFDSDSAHKERLFQHCCKTCFYLRHPIVALSAMTKWNCGICGKEEVCGNSDNDKICKECAIEHKLCTYCGGDIDMREKRRKFNF